MPNIIPKLRIRNTHRFYFFFIQLTQNESSNRAMLAIYLPETRALA